MSMILTGIAFWLSILVFPVITLLLMELKKEDRNYFLIVVYNIFLSVWLFGVIYMIVLAG